MSWLVTQLWPWMLLSAALGAVVTTALSTTRVTVERWVEVAETPAPSVPSTPDPTPVVEVEEPAAPPEPASPFPALPGASEERPWEAEELWSKPARLAGPGDRKRRTSPDEWSEAASSWRTWAEEAVTGRPVGRDDDGWEGDGWEADRDRQRRSA
jgi:hypothetical protein